ncbi:MAG: CesT family type III secretion system chaperone [Pseudomonadota bacterium]
MDSYRNAVDRSLAVLFADAGEDFSLDENGMTSIALENNITITLELGGNEDRLYIRVPLLSLAPSQTEFLKTALETNLFSMPSDQTWIAYDRDIAALVLCGALGDEARDPESLRAILESVAIDATQAGRALNGARTGNANEESLLTDVSSFKVQG